MPLTKFVPFTERDWTPHGFPERTMLYTATRIYIAELWLGMQK